GRVIVVTGAGSGIGRCTAHELAALGAEVVLVGRTPAKLAAVADEIHLDGGRAQAAPCDIREEDAVKALIAQLVATHGRIDGLVNNAGGQFPAALSEISLKGWQAVLQTNLTGGFLMARECYRQSMRAHGGAIVNMLADMWHGMPGMGHSGAARAGMLNFTETAASEWAPVRVNAVAPGWIASSGMDTYPPAMKPLIRSLRGHVPAARLGTEAEVSAAIAFLLSEAAAFISGTCLRIDGGAPNARRHWPLAPARPTEPFEGFHRGVRPRVLED
ncbi:MAG TPA: SDR family oxidoreductase, partial [Steroidobacteraceae bacterium]|nr:SDR family oxidoreductase [Steroidobacteraceae bacterium]